MSSLASRVRTGRGGISGGTMGAALPVAAGLAVQAVTAYATLILAGRILGAAQFGGLAALYVLITTVATGLFQPLEQEVARRRGRTRETGVAEPGLLRRATVFGVCLCVLVIAAALALHGPAVHLLGGHQQLLAALCLALPGYALCFVVRGALSGSRRFVRYGVQLSVEGTFRLVALGLLALVGADSVTAYGWLFGLAPWVAVVCSVVGLRPSAAFAPTQEAETVPAAMGTARPLVAPLALLLAGTLSAQLLIGAGPITAQLFSSGSDAALAGAFLAALVVVRVPVFLFTAVQPSMLPAMAAHVAAGRRAEFAGLLRRVLAVMGLVALVTTAVTTALGPWGLRLLFGPGFDLSWGVFLLMGASVGLFMTAGVLGQAVLALGEHRRVTLGWVVGLVGLGVGMSLGSGLVGRATVGLLVGAAAAAVSLAVLLWHAMRRWPHRVADLEAVAAVGLTTA